LQNGETNNVRSNVDEQNMNLEDLKQEVIYSNSASRLRELTVDIAMEISRQHVLLVKTDDAVLKTEIRGKISVLSTLQNIIDKRMDEVILAEKEDEKKELYTNRQYRKAAEAILPKETLDQLYQMSTMEYKKFKELRAALKEEKGS
jgi:hypothetical protein